jgi:tRNA (guanine37-N1)-methyltransferase
MGNPESLAEESHGGDGLLEYPVYTKPPSWRGLEVPEVLRSGDHARIEGWRREQAERRTALRRPDLLHPSRAVRAGDLDLTLRPAAPGDAGELLSLQRACYAGTPSVDAEDTGAAAAVHEELADVIGWLPGWTTLLAHAGPRLVGAVRVRLLDQEWRIDRLMVVPDLRGRGLGGWLLAQAEATAPTVARRATLCAVAEGEGHQARWRKAGYRPERGGSGAGPARLTKPLRRAR